MKAIVRKNDEAVSPVIATILMVAITVVLAAVLYVMVSGLISTPSTSQQIGVNVSRSSDGTNWIVSFTSVPTGLTNTTVSISLSTSSGAVALAATPLGSASTLQPKGVIFTPIQSATTTLSAGDRILISITTYSSGTTFQLTGSSGILASGTLQ